MRLPKFRMNPEVYDLILERKKIEKKEVEGCGVLFKSGSGIIICGEKRTDGNQFLCKWCLKESSQMRDKENIK